MATTGDGAPGRAPWLPLLGASIVVDGRQKPPLVTLHVGGAAKWIPADGGGSGGGRGGGRGGAAARESPARGRGSTRSSWLAATAVAEGGRREEAQR